MYLILPLFIQRYHLEKRRKNKFNKQNADVTNASGVPGPEDQDFNVFRWDGLMRGTVKKIFLQVILFQGKVVLKSQSL